MPSVEGDVRPAQFREVVGNVRYGKFDCKMCSARRVALMKKVWTVGFRLCPLCGSRWK